MVAAWIYRGPYAGSVLDLTEPEFYRANSEDWGEAAQPTPRDEVPIAPQREPILGKWAAAEAFWRVREGMEPAPAPVAGPRIAADEMILPPPGPLDPTLMVRRARGSVGYKFNSPPAAGADAAVLPH